jgi:4-hydroxybenzoate polyprenyltransferase
MPLGAALRLLRPKQWAKNLLVFAALIFTGRFSDSSDVVAALLAFAALCFISSATYVVNDILDIDKDRAHPVKRNRPLASGAIGVGVAWGLAAACLILGIVVGFLIRPTFLYGITVYLALQFAYNLFAKRVPILDVFVIGIGFVLRAALGAVAIQVGMSAWLLFCTGVLALLIGFGKRRHEFLLDGHDAGASRPALTGYTLSLLDNMVVFSAALAGLSYGVYAIQSQTGQTYPALVLTIPFVIYGVARYMFLIFAKGDGGEPENIVLRDPHMIATLVLFVGAAVYAVATRASLPYILPH